MSTYFGVIYIISLFEVILNIYYSIFIHIKLIYRIYANIVSSISDRLPGLQFIEIEVIPTILKDN